MDAAQPGSRANLPHILTQFIGRQQEVAELRRLLDDRRLLTLTGPGGSGKTRLALEVATGLTAAHPGGVWLVELAELNEPELVPQAVAAVLAVCEAPGQSSLATMSHFLRSRRALLLLDNCEHLLDTCAHLAAALLQGCPDLRLLVTSRQALGLPGEIVRPMLPLALPATDRAQDLAALAQVEAIALFLDRATALAPDFSLTASNAASVIQICRLLDGMPLAIELAAARVPVLSVAQIAGRLDDSLRLLTAGPRLGLLRHQTMRAAIDWSYALLTGPEQTLWRRLSVFRGNFSLAAVEFVCSPPSTVRAHHLDMNHWSPATDILDLLTQLVHKSLVQVTRGGAEVRYQLL